MEPGLPDDLNSPHDRLRPAEGVIVATEEALPLRLERLAADPSLGQDLVVLGSFLGERLVARCAVPLAAAAMIEDQELLRDPVRLVLAVREASPGLQCQLFALVSMPLDRAETEPEVEPWAASSPGASYDRAVGLTPPESGRDDSTPAAVLLGQIVRFDRDRRFPASLPEEAVDVLSAIVQGKLVEVVDKLLDDLLE
ncbi:MAG: hypothetical protein SGI84_11415 [Gemmatimonadota bacterium]|nr:hypothetical protein [Gemmatimonadota bacterium]